MSSKRAAHLPTAEAEQRAEHEDVLAAGQSPWMPAVTSIRAPTRPTTSTLPAYGYITLVRIFNSVDLPDPLIPISPTDSPGSATSHVRSAQRQRCDDPVRESRRRARSIPYECAAAIGAKALPDVIGADRAVRRHRRTPFRAS